MMNDELYYCFLSCCFKEKKRPDDRIVEVHQDVLTINPKLRSEICQKMAGLIYVLDGNNISLASYANQDMSLGVIVSHILNLPFLYLRNSPKKYGLKNQIEGQLTSNQNIVFFTLFSPTPELYDKTKAVFTQKNSEIIQWVSLIGNELYYEHYKTIHVFLYSQQEIYTDLMGRTRNRDSNLDIC